MQEAMLSGEQGRAVGAVLRFTDLEARYCFRATEMSVWLGSMRIRTVQLTSLGRGGVPTARRLVGLRADDRADRRLSVVPAEHLRSMLREVVFLA